MTMMRDETMLDLDQFPLTAAEVIALGFGVLKYGYGAVTERAWWEWAMEQDAMDAAAEAGVTNAS